jgi:enoyl-CoA hydratase/carnithine racemase
MTDSSDVVAKQDGAILTLSLNRPTTRNGLLPETCEQLAGHLEQAASNADIRCVVFGSGEKAFCSGADLSAAAASMGTRPHDELIRDTFHRLIRAIVAMPQPVLASIRGPAVGFGFDMALACDLRIAGQSSKFGAVFSRLGLVPDGGSSFTLSRLVGIARAKELVYLAETFDGERAEALGIVNKVVADEALDAATGEWAARLAAGPPIAYRYAKRNIDAGLTGTLDEALDREIEAQVKCLSSADLMEGVQAFFQKRPPQFQGR